MSRIIFPLDYSWIVYRAGEHKMLFLRNLIITLTINRHFRGRSRPRITFYGWLNILRSLRYVIVLLDLDTLYII